MTDTRDVPDGGAPDLLQIQYDLACRLARSGGLAETLRLCQEAAMRATGLECGGVYLVEDDGGARLACHEGLGEPFRIAAAYHGPDSRQAAFVRAGQPLYTNVRKLDKPGLGDLLAGFEALAIVPVRAEGAVVGCLNLASARLAEVPDHARLALEPLAQQIGQAILRERTLTALREREASLNAFFDRVSDFLFVLDERGDILHANETAYLQLGWEPGELAGRSVLALHPPEQRNEVRAVISEMIAGRRDVCMIPLQARDGRRIPVETRVTRGPWAGRPAFFGVSRGIGDRLAAEQARRWAGLAVLAGSVAHDFNNILMRIQGNVDLLRQDLDQPDRPPEKSAQERLQGVTQAVRRASGLCQRMLAYSGREQLRFDHVDGGRLVREIVSRLVPPGRPGLAVTVTADPHLPAVRADEQQLGHAIGHLLQNALEALDEDGGRIDVLVWFEASPSPRVLLAIEDDGCGMSAATCARMFEPFFSTKFVGRGLGAAAAHGVVSAHHGTIAVRSAVGKGTTVTLALPALVSRPDAPAGGSGATPPVEDGEVVLNGGRNA